MSTIKTLRDALERIAELYENNSNANSIRQASLLYDSRCIARTALATKDAPALEAVPDAEFERLLTEFGNLQFDCGAWDEDDNDGNPPPYGALVKKSRAARNALRLAASRPQPAKQEAAPLEVPEGQYKNVGMIVRAIGHLNGHEMVFRSKLCTGTHEAGHVAKQWAEQCAYPGVSYRLEIAQDYAYILATKQSPAAPTNAKEST